jgi:hypothetical protein
MRKQGWKRGYKLVDWRCCSDVERGCIGLLRWIGERVARAFLKWGLGAGMGIGGMALAGIEVLRRWMLLEMVVGSSNRCRCVGILVLETELGRRFVVVAGPVAV